MFNVHMYTLMSESLDEGDGYRIKTSLNQMRIWDVYQVTFDFFLRPFLL